MAKSKEYMAKYMTERYHRRRAQVVEMLGGECVECGSTELLQLDHIDASQKSFAIGKALSGWSWARLEPEIAKLQLLCRDHHIAKSKLDVHPEKTTTCCGKEWTGKAYAGHKRWCMGL